MLTQISFTAEEELKKKAMQKAKAKGVTLKSVLIFSMEAFANDKIEVGLITSVADVEELYFDSPSIEEKSAKLAALLK